VKGEEAWCPRRDEAYLGVLVDDLITMGTREPYRMFTSRAEYRLLLREDNADERLTEKGRELGLVGEERWCHFSNKREAIARENERMASTWVQPGSTEAIALEAFIEKPLAHEYNLAELIKRPELDYQKIAALCEGSDVPVVDPQVAQQIEIKAKYSGYIDRQRDDIERLRRHENTVIPEDFDYSEVKGLSNEVKQKLDEARPTTLARAARTQGVTPAAVSLLLIYLKKRAVVAENFA